MVHIKFEFCKQSKYHRKRYNQMLLLPAMMLSVILLYNTTCETVYLKKFNLNVIKPLVLPVYKNIRDRDTS